MRSVHELTLSVALPLAALLLGCSDEATTSTASSTTGGVQNGSPAWTDAPGAPVPLGEGQSLTLPLTLSDPDGDGITLALSPPAGLEVEADAEAGELRVYADYGAVGALPIPMVLDDGRGGVTEIELTVQVSPLVWKEAHSWAAAEGPEAREHGALMALPDGRSFLYGGSGYSPYGTPLSDAWAFDPAARTWSALTPSGDIPPPGASRRVAQAPGASEAYLFGGYEADFTDSDALYRVDLSGSQPVFQLLSQVNPPHARSLHAFAYDHVTGRFFVFGGYGTGVRGDTMMGTLAGDTVTWTDLAPEPSPSKRYGFFYGVDADRGRLVVWSGATGVASLKPAKDAWALDLRAETPSWQLLVPDQDLAPGRRNGCSVFDPTASRLFIFGGTADAMTTEEGLFVLDVRPGKERIVRVDREGAPELRSSGFGFFDGAAGEAWMGFGNTATDVYRDFGVFGYAAAASR